MLFGIALWQIGVAALLLAIAVRLLFGRPVVRKATMGAVSLMEKLKVEFQALKEEIERGATEVTIKRRLDRVSGILRQLAKEDISLGQVLVAIRREIKRLEGEHKKQQGYVAIYQKAREKELELDEMDGFYAEQAATRVEVLTQQIAVFKDLEEGVENFQTMVRQAKAKAEAREHGWQIEGTSLGTLFRAREGVEGVLGSHVDTELLKDPLRDIRVRIIADVKETTQKLAMAATEAPAPAVGMGDPVAMRAEQLRTQLATS